MWVLVSNSKRQLLSGEKTLPLKVALGVYESRIVTNRNIFFIYCENQAVRKRQSGVVEGLRFLCWVVSAIVRTRKKRCLSDRS
jgi:hypothetical protein